MFSLAFKAFVMFTTFLLFHSSLYIVLAHGKGPKKAFIKTFSKQKTLNKKLLDLQLCFMHLMVCG